MFDLTSMLISVAVFVIALTFHEFCHAVTAYILGDKTAYHMGRLTLNPLAHIDPLGLLLLFFIRFGWAKPVPFNPDNFSRPRLYSVLVGLAGPTSNLLLACLSVAALQIIPPGFSSDAIILYIQFFKTSVWVNVMLSVFNLLPIPPLDGSHLIKALLPESFLIYYAQFERISFILLIGVMCISEARILLTSIIVSIITYLEYLF